MQRIRDWAASPLSALVGPVCFALCAMCVSSRQIILTLLHHKNSFPNGIGYSQALLAVDYISHGFARRGLNGTISELLSHLDGIDRYTNLHAFSAFYAALPIGLLLVWLARRFPLRALWLAIVVVVSPQTFRGWAIDVAHGDPMVVGFVGTAALLAALGHYRWATLPLAMGTLSHEAAVIYGAPLLLLIAWDGGCRRRALGGLIGLLVVECAILLLLQHWLSAPVSVMARSVLTSGARHPEAELAAYFTIGGLSSIATWQCAIWGTAIPLISIPASFAIVGSYAIILLPTDRRMAAMIALAALVPMTFMFFAAIDYGRYAMLAIANACILAAVLHARSQRRIDTKIVGLGAAFFAVLLFGRPAHPWYPTGSLARFVNPNVADDMAGPIINRCNPHWLTDVRYVTGRG